MDNPGRIVAAVDVSGISTVVVGASQRAAKMLGTGVRVVNVVEPIIEEGEERSYLLPALKRMAEETRTALEEDFDRFSKGIPPPPEGVDRDFHLVHGRAHKEIINQVMVLDAPLLVVGAPSASALAATTLGRVLRRSPVPVLVARKPVKAYNKVLVGFDFSSLSTGALEFAARLAAPDALIRLVNVIPRSFGPRLFESTDDLRARAEEEMCVEAEKTLPGREVVCAALSGAARTELVAEAERFGADLIAVGVSAGHSIAEVFLGSVADGVAKHAGCDVLVFSRGREDDA